ncbi:MAG: alpha-L-fucosidase [Oscillospiraceae bacterium]
MWYQTDYRRIFMDMHLNDSDKEYLSKLDVKSFVGSLKEADASSVVVKAKSHVGLHYWKSKYGRMHNTLKERDLDYVGEMIKECHANNINVILYFSQMYDNYAYETHKSWRLKYVSGVSSRFPNGKNKRYGLVCPNNPKYQKYCEEILTELAENYDFEGIFLDMPFWPAICYCPSCRKRYLKETGKAIPIIQRLDKDSWKEYISVRQRWIQEYMEHNTKALKKVNPNIAIEHNMAAIGLNWVTGNTEPNFEASDYAGGDYYGGYLEQSFMCKYYNNMTINKPFCYITSRCDSNLIFHTVSRTMEDLLIHSMNALVHNGAYSICDAMNPDGTITDKMYKGPIKEVFATTKPLEKYVSGNIKSDVAVWYNTAYKVNSNYIKSPLNIASILREKNIAFDIIGSKNIEETKAKVISINDAQKISDDEVLSLQKYLKNGGNLFITGTLGNNKNLEKLVGVKVKGNSAYTYSYLTPTEKFNSLMKEFDKKSPYPIEHCAIEAEVIDKDVEIIATISYPYTLRSSSDFSAIHSDPPGIHTNLPGITKVKRENGYVIWAASPLELTEARNCKQSIADIICSLIDDDKREFFSNAPAFVEIVKWEKESKTYLGIINQQNETPIYPINNIKITLNEEYKSVELVSQKTCNINWTADSGKTEIEIPALNVFHIIELE